MRNMSRQHPPPYLSIEPLPKHPRTVLHMTLVQWKEVPKRSPWCIFQTHAHPATQRSQPRKASTMQTSVGNNLAGKRRLIIANIAISLVTLTLDPQRPKSTAIAIDMFFFSWHWIGQSTSRPSSRNSSTMSRATLFMTQRLGPPSLFHDRISPPVWFVPKCHIPAGQNKYQAIEWRGLGSKYIHGVPECKLESTVHVESRVSRFWMPQSARWFHRVCPYLSSTATQDWNSFVFSFL